MVYSSAPLLFYNNYTKFNQSTRHFLFNWVWPIDVALTWIQSCDALEAEDTQSDLCMNELYSGSNPSFVAQKANTLSTTPSLLYTLCKIIRHSQRLSDYAMM